MTPNKDGETLEDVVVKGTGKSIVQGIAELLSDDWLKKALKKPPKGSTHEWVTYESKNNDTK